MKIHKINSTMVHIVNFDQIPLVKLVSKHGLSLLNQRYGFSNIQVDQAPNGTPVITFLLGSFDDEEGEVVLKKLVIEERKTIISIENPSEQAESVYQDLKIFFQEIGEIGNDDYMTPIVTSVESEVVAQLNFNAERLIAPNFLKFVKTDVLKAMPSKLSNIYIVPEMISFRVEFPKSDEMLHDYRIGLSRKEFYLAPRQGFPLEERIFVSKAPIETGAHLALLEVVEKIFVDE